MTRRPSCAALFLAFMALAVFGPVGTAQGVEPDPRAPSPPVSCVGCWVPPLTMSWQWQLSGTVDTSVDAQMYDVDGFETSASVVQDLHDAGRHVVCYISSGSREKWRPDADRFPSRVVGNPLDGWPGERWLDVRRWKVLGPIMRDRLDMCDDKGFDAVEFDNINGWSNKTGFPLTKDDQLSYNIRLANAAHERGLAAFLKNDVEQAGKLEAYFDAALDEECFTWDECERLSPFTDGGKPVFVVEYDLSPSQFCPQAATLGFNAMKKKLALGVWRDPC